MGNKSAISLSLSSIPLTKKQKKLKKMEIHSNQYPTKMILTLNEYNKILQDCEELIERYELPSVNLCEKYEIDYDTLLSLCSQLHIKQIKKYLYHIEQDLTRINEVRNTLSFSFSKYLLFCINRSLFDLFHLIVNYYCLFICLEGTTR